MKDFFPARRRGCSTCYLFAVGAAVEPWKLASLLEDQLRESVDVTAAPPNIVAAFPPGDAVRVVTHRSCSCDLVDTRPRVGYSSRLSVALLPMLRAPLVRGVMSLESLRVYVSSGAEPKAFTPKPRVLPLDEFSAVADGFPLDSLVELTRRSLSQN